MIQVISHFFDLNKSIQVASELIKPGGYILVETWNKDSLPAKIFGKFWHEYNPPSVIQWFSAKSLEMLFNRYGLTKIAEGRPSKWLSGSHAKLILRSKIYNFPLNQLFTKILNFVPDKLPIPYPSLELFWSLFRRIP